MVLNGIDDSIISKQFAGIATSTDEFYQTDKSLRNAFSSEMAQKTIKDFKGRSRTNMVSRVAKRIKLEEKRTKDLQSTITS